MPNFSNSLLSYEDVRQVFQNAGELGLVTLEFADHRKATTWVSRANKFRVLLRKDSEAKGGPFASIFDHLVIRRKPQSMTVRIEPRGYDFASAVGPDGKPLELSKQTLQAEAPKAAELESIDNFLDEYEGKSK